MTANGDTGFTVHGIDALRFPVLLSVPHAGRDYPREIFDNLRLPAASLVRLEDRYADLLARDAVAQGFPAIVAHRARAWIDLNRHEQDLDIEMVTGLDRAHLTTPGSKQRGGLGLIPRRLAGEGEIWKRPLPAAAVEERLEHFYRPYHAMVSAVLDRMLAQFGIAILLDLHSMPPLVANGAGPVPRFVVGDRFGRSASGRMAETLLARLRAHGFACALNHPYSGDHMLRQHGKPRRNIHALQLEVDRSLYLDLALREPGAGLASVARTVADLAHLLAEEAGNGDTLLAAE